MRHEQAANLARALANAVRPERTAARWRFWKWLARRRLADDERARSHLTHELTQLVETLVIPDEWMPEPLGRRIVDGVMKALWMTESPGLRQYVKDVRATVIIDESVAAQGFVANIGIGDETVRIQTRYPSREQAELAAYNWVDRIGAVSSLSARTRSVERVPEVAPVSTGDVTTDPNWQNAAPPEFVVGDDHGEAERGVERQARADDMTYPEG